MQDSEIRRICGWEDSSFAHAASASAVYYVERYVGT